MIPDTLLITHSRILSGQPVIEGTELQLTCAASVQSDQHTHVSVTFGVRSSRGPESSGSQPQRDHRCRPRAASDAGPQRSLREEIPGRRDRCGEAEGRRRPGSVHAEDERSGTRGFWVIFLRGCAMDQRSGWQMGAHRTEDHGARESHRSTAWLVTFPFPFIHLADFLLYFIIFKNMNKYNTVQ